MGQRISWLGAVVLLVGLSGCAAPDGDPWHGRDLEGADPPWRDVTLEPGKGMEMTFFVTGGEALPYDWFTMDRTRIPFNIHYHTPQGAEETPLEGTFYEHSGPFVAQRSAAHNLFWMNTGTDPVELWIQAEGEDCTNGCQRMVTL